MMHIDHRDAPNYSPAQILADSCPACADRGDDLLAAVEQMDDETFARAWDRAQQKAAGKIRDLSEAECRLLDVLWAVKFRAGMIGACRPLAVTA